MDDADALFPIANEVQLVLDGAFRRRESNEIVL